MKQDCHINLIETLSHVFFSKEATGLAELLEVSVLNILTLSIRIADSCQFPLFFNRVLESECLHSGEIHLCVEESLISLV